jgi:hypothetical protein
VAGSEKAREETKRDRELIKKKRDREFIKGIFWAPRVDLRNLLAGHRGGYWG